MKYFAVVCGNSREFAEFSLDKIHEKDRPDEPVTMRNGMLTIGDRRYFNVMSRDQIRGMNLEGVVYYGTWTNRKDLSELREEIELRCLHTHTEQSAKDGK